MMSIKDYVSKLESYYLERVQHGPAGLTEAMLLQSYSLNKQVGTCGDNLRCAYHEIDTCNSNPTACMDSALGKPGTLKRQLNDMRGQALLKVAMKYRDSALPYDGISDPFSSETATVNMVVDTVLGALIAFRSECTVLPAKPAPLPFDNTPDERGRLH